MGEGSLPSGLSQLRVRERERETLTEDSKGSLFLFDLEKAVKIQLAFYLALHPQDPNCMNVEVSVFYYYQKLLS